MNINEIKPNPNNPRKIDADANWDSDSEAAAFWVRRAVMDYGVE